MPRTSSLAFPNMLNPTSNQVNVVEDNASIVNRVRLLMLTDPTEIFNEPEQGVGLRRYLWQYNNENVKAMIRDRVKSQLRQFEPCVDADQTSFADGLLFSKGSKNNEIDQQFNTLNMTIGLHTIYGDEVSVETNDKQITEFDSSLPTGIFDGTTDV